MAYKLNQITIRTNNSKEEMENIIRIWKDIESTVTSEYTKDGKAHCYLYIAIQ